MWLSIVTLAVAGPNTVLLGFTATSDIVPIRASVEALGGELRRCHPRARFCVADFPADPPMVALSALDGLRYVERDTPILPEAQQALPADASGTADCADLWEIDTLGLPDAWPLMGPTPVVAVADGGFLEAHEEIAGQISGQYDYGDNDRIAEVEWQVGIPDHGTFIAALIAGNGDNGVGRVGVVPGGALNLLKIADSDGALYFSYAASAVADVADGDLGIGVLNYSIASSSDNAAFRDAVASLADVGVLFVAAAGNCSSDNCRDANNDQFPLYPASYDMDHVVSVAGSTRDIGFNTYSHYGLESVDLAAPGVDLCSAGVNDTDNYYTASGTSYATPLVAGAAALIMGVHPDITPAEVARVLRASVRPDPAWSARVESGGVLDIQAALTTPVPRLAEPAEVRVEEEGTLRLSWENVGAAGDATIVLTHGAGVRVGAAGEWAVTAVAPGGTVDLADVGRVSLPDGGTLLAAPVGSHQTQALIVELIGVQRGVWPLTARLLTAESDGKVLGSPWKEGGTDPTGAPAWEVEVTVAAVSPDAELPGEDSGDPDEEHDEQDPEKTDEDAAGCGCDSGRPSMAWGMLALAVLLQRRAARSAKPIVHA